MISGTTCVTCQCLVYIMLIGVRLVVSVSGYQLNLLVTSSSRLEEPRGLLGNFNSDPLDDFIGRDGTRLTVNSSEEEIYYKFAESC